MSYYSNLSITVRRKDKSPVTGEDLKKFTEFFFDEFEWNETYDEPHMCSDGKYIHASCQIYKDLEKEEILVFSEKNPHLQIEVIQECEDYDIGNSRMLFEGEVSEVLTEVKYFESPTLIDWQDEALVKEGDTYGKLLNKPEFLQSLGEQICLALEDMLDNTGREELGEYVIESVMKNAEGENMFSAIVGWTLDDMIARANDALKYNRE